MKGWTGTARDYPDTRERCWHTMPDGSGYCMEYAHHEGPHRAPVAQRMPQDDEPHNHDAETVLAEIARILREDWHGAGAGYDDQLEAIRELLRPYGYPV